MHRIALTSLALLAPVMIALPANAAGETCDGLAATIVVPVGELAYPNNPYFTKPLTGTPGDDVIAGTPLNDSIDGAGGNDVICGLDGADTLTGGAGDDRLFGGLDGRETDPDPADNSSLGDLLVPGPGDDHVDLGQDPEADDDTFRPDQVRYDDSATGVNVDLTPVNGLGRAFGEGNDTIVVLGPMTVVGSPFDDSIIGSPYDDLLMTDRGGDLIRGADGDDVILPDIAGFDVMETADPEGEGFASPDVVVGGAGDDVISSRWGATDAHAGDGDDYVQVSDTAFGGNGTADGSRIEGGTGDDEIVARYVRRLRVSGDDGDDEIFHSIYGGPGLTFSSGGDGDDRLAIATATGLKRGSTITVDRRKSYITTKRTVVPMRGYEHHRFTGAGITWVYVGTNAKDDINAERVGNLRATTFGGRDRVQASRGRDHLDLGRGVDTADGSLRRDTCISVERAKSCEVRR